MSIIMILVATILPIRNLILMEQHLLKSRHTIQLALHDELLDVLYDDVPLTTFKKEIVSHEVKVVFTEEGDYVKGCASWQNEKRQEELRCLYGIKE